jgi:RNA polymerase sigma-70 factor (ECF subfamily)
MSPPRDTVIALHAPPASGATLADRDDEALMTLASGDQRAAFEVLVGRYLPRLTSYCAKFLGSARTGEEVAQDVLLEVWARRQRYRSRGKFQVFLFTLTRNRCLNHARDERRRRRWDVAGGGESAAVAAAAASSPDQLDLLLEEELRRHVRAALLELRPKLREAVLLRFDQGLEYPEIARIVGRPESTVRSRIFLALKRLREAVA